MPHSQPVLFDCPAPPPRPREFRRRRHARTLDTRSLFAQFGPLCPLYLTIPEANAHVLSVQRYIFKQASYWSRRLRPNGNSEELFDDIVSAGQIAACKAAISFNPQTPNPKNPGAFVKWTTYACWAINKGTQNHVKIYARESARGTLSLDYAIDHNIEPDELTESPRGGWSSEDWRTALMCLPTTRMRLIVKFRFIDGLTLRSIKYRLPGKRLSKQTILNQLNAALAILGGVDWLKQEAGVAN